MASPIELSEDAGKKKNLVVQNLQEVLGDDRLTKLLSSSKNVHIYWGSATTGRPHVGYFVPMQKIADFLHAGIKVTILFADLHAFLDNMKSTFKLLENRVKYYEKVIKALLSAFNVPIDKLHFVKGSTYQLSREYTEYLYQLCAHVSQRDALKAGAEVVKQVESPFLSGLLYPLLQALDEHFLKVDGQFGGVDQRKIFILAEEQLPKLKLFRRFHLMNAMVPGLTGSKMSSSEENTKIDLLDSAEVVNRKIDSASCPKKDERDENGEEVENGILAFYKVVVLPVLALRRANNNDDASFLLTIDSQSFNTFDEISKAFNSDKLTEKMLKDYLKTFLNEVLDKVRLSCNNEEMRSIIAEAYPSADKLDEKLSERTDAVIRNQVASMSLEDGDVDLSKLFGESECIYGDRFGKRIAQGNTIRVAYRCSIKGRVNLAHLAALWQLKQLKIRHGWECAILLSDLSAFFDNDKCPYKTMKKRTNYYNVMLKSMMKVVGLEDVNIRSTSEFEFEKEYTLNMYKITTKVTRDETALVKGNTLATHLCSILFLLDLNHHGVDLVLVGENQRPFVELAHKMATFLGVSAPAALIIPEIIGMNGYRMSSSDVEFCLEPFDTPKQLRKKVAKSFCEPGNVKGNVALSLARNIIFPLMNVINAGKKLTANEGDSLAGALLIERSEENGGNMILQNYDNLEQSFVDGKLHPADLKAAVTDKINALFQPIQKELEVNKFGQKWLDEAFPKVQSKK